MQSEITIKIWGNKTQQNQKALEYGNIQNKENKKCLIT